MRNRYCEADPNTSTRHTSSLDVNSGDIETEHALCKKTCSLQEQLKVGLHLASEGTADAVLQQSCLKDSIANGMSNKAPENIRAPRTSGKYS